MLALNETTFMLTGGGNSYEFETNTTLLMQEYWIEGPRLEIPRRVHACGILNAPNGTRYAVVSGGASVLSQQSVEFLDLDRMDLGWFPGPYLPKPLYAHSMVATENSLVVIGGLEKTNGDDDEDGVVSKDLFELTCKEGGQCQWREMEQKMQIGRSNMVAMMVPDHLTNCDDN